MANLVRQIPNSLFDSKLSYRYSPNVAFAFILIFVYIAALKPVGFMLASAVFIFALCVLLTPDYAKRNYLGYAVFSVLLSAGTYFLFKNVLYIALPAGTVFGG